MTFVGYGGISVRRQGVQGLHVHVGMPSGEDCWRCLEAIVPWLPVVLGMSANSPWFAGELNGMASNRAPILAELPRAGAPPAFASYEEWESWVERLARSRGRRGLHAHLVGRPPASEARDARGARRPTSRRTSVCRRRSPRSCRRSARPRSPAGCRATACCSPTAGAPTTARTAGRRHGSGPAREFVHPDGSSYVPADELGAELLELVRPAARAARRRRAARAPRPRGLRGRPAARAPIRRRPRRRISSPAR